jgi:hypothetical protein
MVTSPGRPGRLPVDSVMIHWQVLPPAPGESDSPSHNQADKLLASSSSVRVLRLLPAARTRIWIMIPSRSSRTRRRAVAESAQARLRQLRLVGFAGKLKASESADSVPGLAGGAWSQSRARSPAAAAAVTVTVHGVHGSHPGRPSHGDCVLLSHGQQATNDVT